MNDVAEFVQSWWTVIMAMLGFTAWLARLEARSMTNGRGLSKESAERRSELIALELRLEKQRQEDLTLRREDREDTKQILREMQGDIKLLLQRGVSRD